MSNRRTQCRAVHGGTLAAVAAAVGVGLAAPATWADDPVNGVSGGRNIITTAERLVAPAANTTVTNARVLVADGSSLTQTVASPPETHWFAVPVESGKSYVIELINVEGDLPANALQTVGLFDSDGSSPPPEAQVDCTMSGVAPSLEILAGADGVRCTVRTNIPAAASTRNKRGIFVSVLSNFGPSFQIRAREATIYGRWTTNGYDFHTEVQNTTSEALCVQVAFMPGLGTTPPTGPVVVATELMLPPHGALKTVLPTGTLSGGDNKGDLRILGCAQSLSPKNFVPGSVHVSTYAFNPVTSQYLYFFPWTANGGAAGNSW